MNEARLRRGAAHPADPNLRLWRYHKDYPNGLWVTLEKFGQFQSSAAKDRARHRAALVKPVDRLKRGDVHPETGFLFWQYAAGCVDGHLWYSPDVFAKKMAELGLYQTKHKERQRAAKRKFLAKHKERLKAVTRVYNKKAQPRAAAWRRHKIATDPVFALACRVRARIREALRDRYIKKSQKSTDIVGCGWGELRDHLESKFVDGMTWDNMKLWHVDHIIPLATAKTEEQVFALCHYSNLQPLWAGDNLSKSSKLNYQHTRL